MSLIKTGSLNGHQAQITSLASGTLQGTDALFSGSEDRTCRVWDQRTSRAVKGIRGFATEISAVQFISEHGLVVSSGSDLFVYDSRALGVVGQAAKFAAHVDIGQVEAIDTRGDFVAFVDEDGHLGVADCDEGTAVRFTGGHAAMASCVAFHPDDLKVASGGFDKQVLVWDMASEGIAQRLSTVLENGSSGKSINPPFVYALLFAPFEDTPIVSGHADGRIMCFDQAAGRSVCWLDCHGYSISDMQFVPSNPDRLVTAGLDCMLKVWDAGEIVEPNVVDAGDQMQVVLDEDPPLMAAAGLVSKPDTLAIAHESSDIYVGQDAKIGIYAFAE